MVASRIHEHDGVEPKLGKFQIWGRAGGPETEGIDDLLEGARRPEEPIWKGDVDAERNGIVILGTPVGSPEFVQRFLGNRLTVQSRFWDRLKQVPALLRRQLPQLSPHASKKHRWVRQSLARGLEGAGTLQQRRDLAPVEAKPLYCRAELQERRISHHLRTHDRCRELFEELAHGLLHFWRDLRIAAIPEEGCH